MRTIGLFALAMLSASGVQADALLGLNQVEVLGQTRIGRGYEDVDVIDVAGNCPSAVNRPVSAIQLKVTRADVEIDAFQIQYGNGDWDNIEVRDRFEAGSTSRLIDLPGGLRCIERLRLVGRTRGPAVVIRPRRHRVAVVSAEEALVTVLGARVADYQNGLNSRLLGQTSLSFQQDADAIRINSCNGLAMINGNENYNAQDLAQNMGQNMGLTAIQLASSGNAVRIDRILVRFENGQVDDLYLGAVLAPGQVTQKIDLPGVRRCIDEIVIIGRTISYGREAVVKVFGLSENIVQPAIEILGRTILERNHDADRIRVGACGIPGNRPVRAVKVRVRQNDARIDYILLELGNGQRLSLPVANVIRQGQDSRLIDLPGGARCVEEIFIAGRTISPGPLALIEVLGQR